MRRSHRGPAFSPPAPPSPPTILPIPPQPSSPSRRRRRDRRPGGQEATEDHRRRRQRRRRSRWRRTRCAWNSPARGGGRDGYLRGAAEGVGARGGGGGGQEAHSAGDQEGQERGRRRQGARVPRPAPIPADEARAKWPQRYQRGSPKRYAPDPSPIRPALALLLPACRGPPQVAAAFLSLTQLLLPSPVPRPRCGSKDEPVSRRGTAPLFFLLLPAFSLSHLSLPRVDSSHGRPRLCTRA
ncbi:hypothetical protein VPH35_074591 [Triticum aestivum]